MTPSPARPSRRRPAIAVAAAVLAVTGLVAAGLFQPWRAVLDRTVAEAAPGSGGSARVLTSGEFVSLAHGTTGRASVQQSDGAPFLRIEGLATSDGPDVRVWLSDRGVDDAERADDGRWVELGPLRGNKGDLTYALPSGTDPAAFRSVVLWCKRFSVAFGAAPLDAQS